MIQCRVCGGQNEAGGRFCVSCGIALSAQISPTGVVNPSAQQSLAPSPPGVPIGHHNTASRTTVEPPEPIHPRGKTQMPPTSQMALDQTAPPSSHSHRGPAPPPASWDPKNLPTDAPRKLVGFLISFEVNPLGQYWPIHQGPNLVGRQGASPGLAIEIGHATASSRHAMLYAAANPSRLLIEDVGSTNGSFVNDHYMPPGVKRDLHDGDQVCFGLFTALIKLV